MRLTDQEAKALLSKPGIRVSANSVSDVSDLTGRMAKVVPAQVTLPEKGGKDSQGKYRNQKVEIDGIKFDSKKEGERYRQLKMMEAAGKITDLELQPVFVLAPAITIKGRGKPALRYVADFSYLDWSGGQQAPEFVVEDVKGMLTDVYKIKRHLMKSVCEIEIQEV